MIYRNGQAGLAVILVTAMVTFSLQGCASMPEGSGTAIGGLTGAGIGATLGAVVAKKNPLLGAAIGGVAGGAVGALIGHAIESHQIKDYQTTKQEQKYDPSQGEIVRITEYSIAPPAVAPGDQVAFKATYYVMTANPDQDIPITEVRVLKLRDPETGQYRELGRIPQKVIVKPGTRQVDTSFPIEKDASKGAYMVAFEVSSDRQKDIKEQPLTVLLLKQSVLAAPGSEAVQFSVLPKR